MPVYEYRCEEGHTFEVMQRISDDPVAECQSCGAPVRRVFHPVAVHFKGSGFYSTDYGKRSRNGSASGDDSGDSKASDGASSKSDGDSKSSGDSGKKAETPASSSPSKSD